MWIIVAGPYTSGGAGAERRAENLRVLNRAAVALFRFKVGVIPVLLVCAAVGGVWAGLR